MSIRPWLSALLLISASAGMAAEPDLQQIQQQLEASLPGVRFDQVRPTPLPGLYEVTLRGQVVYMSADGRYLFQGNLIDRQTSVNLTEQTRSTMRAELLNSVADAQTVVFSPKNPKYSITIFTDTSCGYCRKLHQEVAVLNKKGVKVRYLLYPRAGIGSPSYKVLQSVWCAKDQQQAMNTAKSGGKVPEQACNNPIQQHMNLAQQMGLQGTPMIITDSGQVVKGYRPAQELIGILAANTP